MAFGYCSHYGKGMITLPSKGTMMIGANREVIIGSISGFSILKKFMIGNCHTQKT
jgi:hypothetical protein